MNVQDLIIEKWISKWYPNSPYMNFFVPRNNGEWDFVGEIIYKNMWEGVIKVIRLHTANLVKNTLVEPTRFWGIPPQTYPWLWVLCLSRFIQEMKLDSYSERIILFSVPEAIWFYRKAANRLLKAWEIVSWKQWDGLFSVNRIPVWIIQLVWDISDREFEFRM